MVKSKMLTVKKKRFVKNYLQSGNGTQAVVDSFDVKKRDTARQMSKQLLKDEMVQNEIQQVMNRQGLTPEYIADKLHESIDKSIGIKGKNADAIKGLDILLKLHNAYPTKQTVNKNMSVRYNMSIKSGMEAQQNLSRLSATTASLLAELKDS